MNISELVRINITRQTAGVAQAGFGTPLILGPNGFSGEIRPYSSLAALAEDFETTDPEYLLGAALLSQTPKPQRVKVGKSSVPVAQVVTITPDVTDQEVTTYTVILNGVEYSFESDATPTAGEVVTGLIGLINADSQPVTASGTTTLILTSDSAGLGFSVSVGSDKLTAVTTTPNTGIASDILNAVQIDNDWYMLFTTGRDAVTVLEAAKTIEAMNKMYGFSNSEAGAKTNGTTDVISQAKAKGFFRTFGFYLETAADQPAPALAGRFLPTAPGSEQWALKNLAGLTLTKLTDGEIANLKSKNANFLTSVAGQTISLQGKVVGNEWIDVIRFIDWVQARMGEAIFGTLINVDKIPFTDGGIGVIEAQMRAVLEEGIRVGGLVSYTVTVPKAASISKNDKAARILRGLKFTGVLAGAIQEVEIDGTITL